MENDVFDAFAGAFHMRSMTAAINRAPFVPGRLGQMGIFRARGIATTAAWIEVKNNRLYLVKARPRGTDGQQNEAELRNAIPLPTLHLPVTDHLWADEVQDVREFGTGNRMQAIQTKVDEKMMTMGRSLDATVEFHRMGAVTGTVLDADGKVLNDLYNTFQVAKPNPVSFPFNASNPDPRIIRKTCTAIVRAIEDELGADSPEYIHAYCGSGFFDKLVDHPEVVKAYDRKNDGEQQRERTARRTLFYGGILFEEYRGKVPNHKGVLVEFIPENEARFFPVGIQDLFDEIYAPADRLSTVNTIGLPRYAMPTRDRKDRFIEIDAQSNPLILCNTPRALRRGTIAS